MRALRCVQARARPQLVQVDGAPVQVAGQGADVTDVGDDGAGQLALHPEVERHHLGIGMRGADDGEIRRKRLRGGRAGIVDVAVIHAGARNERRIALRVDDVVGLHQVVEDAEAAAYGGLAVAEGIVGEAEAGSEVAVVDGLSAARQPGEKARQAGVGSRRDAARRRPWGSSNRGSRCRYRDRPYWGRALRWRRARWEPSRGRSGRAGRW